MAESGRRYRHIYELKKGKFKLEHEPCLVAVLLGDLKGFKLEDRNRLEYRYFDYGVVFIMGSNGGLL